MARTCPQSASVPHLPLSGNQNICPYGQYQETGPGEEVRGAAQADARPGVKAEVGVGEQVRELGTEGDQSTARQERQGG